MSEESEKYITEAVGLPTLACLMLKSGLPRRSLPAG